MRNSQADWRTHPLSTSLYRKPYVAFSTPANPSNIGLDPAALHQVALNPYGTTPWISELKRFLNEAKGKAALVGICFGHQVMAEAFGGKVARSANGWGIGNHNYDIVGGSCQKDGAGRVERDRVDG